MSAESKGVSEDKNVLLESVDCRSKLSIRRKETLKRWMDRIGRTALIS